MAPSPERPLLGGTTLKDKLNFALGVLAALVLVVSSFAVSLYIAAHAFLD